MKLIDLAKCLKNRWVGRVFFVVVFLNMCVYVQSRFPVSGHISSSCMMKYCFSGPQIVERTV